MYAAHGGHAFQAEAQDIAQRAVVDAGGERGYQHHGQAGRGAVFNGLQLERKQSAAAEDAVDAVVQAVELQKGAGDARAAQFFRIAGLRGQAQAVRVQLEVAEALFAAEGDDLRQVVAHGGLAAGELDVEGPAAGHQHVVEPRDVLQREVAALALAGGGEADGAFEAAAVRQLQQHAAAGALVLVTEAAGARAVSGGGDGDRRAVAAALAGGVPEQVIDDAALPDEDAEIPVLGAGLDKVDKAVVPDRLFRRYRAQADGADAGRGGEWSHIRAFLSAALRGRRSSPAGRSTFQRRLGRQGGSA